MSLLPQQVAQVLQVTMQVRLLSQLRMLLLALSLALVEDRLLSPPPWVNDVTTPHFNRAPDATQLFCNIHDKVQVAKIQIPRRNAGFGI